MEPRGWPPSEFDGSHRHRLLPRPILERAFGRSSERYWRVSRGSLHLTGRLPTQWPPCLDLLRRPSLPSPARSAGPVSISDVSSGNTSVSAPSSLPESLGSRGRSINCSALNMGASRMRRFPSATSIRHICTVNFTNSQGSPLERLRPQEVPFFQ